MLFVVIIAIAAVVIIVGAWYLLGSGSDAPAPNSDAETTLLISDIPIDQVGFIDPVHFTAELHGFSSALSVFFGIFITLLIVLLVVSVILTMAGVGAGWAERLLSH